MICTVTIYERCVLLLFIIGVMHVTVSHLHILPTFYREGIHALLYSTYILVILYSIYLLSRCLPIIGMQTDIIVLSVSVRSFHIWQH